MSLFLVAITLAAFWQVLGCDFVNYDDDEYVTNNLYVQKGLTLGSVVWAFTKYHSANWHPLTWLSHMLDCRIWGLNPMGHHLTSLILHILNSLLLLFVLTLMTGCVWRSGFAAALFAVHPLHVESVAWISERKDVLSTLFLMLTIFSYVRYARTGGKGKYLLVLILYALGLMAKPMLVTLPLVLLMLDYWLLACRKDEQEKAVQIWKPLVIEKIPFFLLAAASSLVSLVVQSKSGAVGSMEAYSLGVRVANAFVAYMSYILKMLWPANLAVLYPHPEDTLPAWQVVSSVLVLLVLTVLVVRFGRTRRYLTVGWLWYVVTLIPVIGFVQVGWQAMADRYTYVPLIGLFVIAAWGIPDLAARIRFLKPGYLVLPAIVVVLTLAVLASLQVRHWRNSVTLFSSALAQSDGSYIVYSNLGTALLEAGEVETAVGYLQNALEIQPNRAEAHNNLGSALGMYGRHNDAVAHLKQALRLKPDYADAHNNLGLALEDLGQTDEAVTHFEKAIRLNPNSPAARNSLGAALGRQGRFVEAIEQYEQALRMKPDYPEAHTNLGIALSALGDLEGAIQHYKFALRNRPLYVEAHTNLGNALARQGLYDEAISHYKSALRGNPDYAEAHGNLGNVLALTGKMDDAISHYRESIRLKPEYASAHSNLAAALYALGDYAGAWKEIHLARKHGLTPPSALVEDLSREMPEPHPRY